MPFSLAPVTRRGGRPFCDAICAPIAVRGVITRSIGRRDNDSSPTISLEKFWAATIPLNMRMVDPEFPQSSALCGAAKVPRPCTSITLSPSGFRVHVTPNARMHSSVLAQSAPVE